MFTKPVLFGLAVVVGLGAAACVDDDGGGGTDGVASVSGESSADADGAAADAAAEEELLAYVSCLREQGLDVPDPTVDEDGNLVIERPETSTDDASAAREAFREAWEACGEPPEGAFGGMREESSAEFQDAMLEFAQCMRDQGVDVPDPDFSTAGEDPATGSSGGPFGEALDRTDPAVAAAMEECQEIIADVLPSDAPAGGGG